VAGTAVSLIKNRKVLPENYLGKVQVRFPASHLRFARI